MDKTEPDQDLNPVPKLDTCEYINIHAQVHYKTHRCNQLSMFINASSNKVVCRGQVVTVIYWKMFMSWVSQYYP